METLIPNPSPWKCQERASRAKPLFSSFFPSPATLEMEIGLWGFNVWGLGMSWIQRNEPLQDPKPFYWKLLKPAPLISEMSCTSQLHSKGNQISIQIPVAKPLQPNPTFGICYNTATLSKFHIIMFLSWALAWPSFYLFICIFLMNSSSFSSPCGTGDFVGSPLNKS